MGRKLRIEVCKFSVIITAILLLLSFLCNTYRTSYNAGLFGHDHLNFGAGRSIFVGTLISETPLLREHFEKGDILTIQCSKALLEQSERIISSTWFLQANQSKLRSSCCSSTVHAPPWFPLSMAVVSNITTT